MIVKPVLPCAISVRLFESSVNSYDSQTISCYMYYNIMFESSVNSYDSQTIINSGVVFFLFESSVNSYDSQTAYRVSQ